MSRRGITHSEIIEKAIELMEEVGYQQFSLRELAAKLEIKPSSLYNHIEGIEEINICIAIEAAARLNRILQATIDEAVKSGEALNESDGRDEAFMAAAFAYRRFAEENSQLYEALINMPKSNDDKIISAAFNSFEPLRELIKSYDLRDKENVNFIRGLRSVMHGFVELCNSGFMHRSKVSQDESYEAIIRQYLAILKKKEAQNEKISRGY